MLTRSKPYFRISSLVSKYLDEVTEEDITAEIAVQHKRYLQQRIRRMLDEAFCDAERDY